MAACRFLRLADWGVGEDLHASAAALLDVLRDERPGLIYVPHPADDHPDHRAALPTLRVALQSPGASVLAPQLRAYEVWTPLAAFDHVEDVTGVMATKLRALRCHASQVNGIRYDRAVRGLNAYRGVMAARCRYAEVFAEVSASEAGRGG
jgi:LmbE family N-acetylglucosaminyl deacetylase